MPEYLYLCKVALDIEDRHIPEDKNGVRIAELDVLSYRKLLWDHRPLTNFRHVGRGYAKMQMNILAEIYIKIKH